MSSTSSGRPGRRSWRRDARRSCNRHTTTFRLPPSIYLSFINGRERLRSQSRGALLSAQASFGGETLTPKLSLCWAARTAVDPGSASKRLSLASVLRSLFPFLAQVRPASSESVLLSNQGTRMQQLLHDGGQKASLAQDQLRPAQRVHGCYLEGCRGGAGGALLRVCQASEPAIVPNYGRLSQVTGSDTSG